ncbi:hypothetical protein SAMN05216559_1499 [Halomicrobium zhouii]|uniref:DUF7527 domain-containing protein n=1 Tax=Halomicrobium zhouii TaxID=767519 RepID=A0A1I6KT14_9EURY|nr:hypothetical protein [Halomicrobium zhouii]SFR94324.1 hypothetical protein SAMN05216559_1499 [Halomicrobium zhouii]
MSPRTVERVDDWETVPFGGGYSGLRDLASAEFSGVVTAGHTRLFMIRGTVVGILEGSIDDFEEASGNAREAPHPALPLLAVMQERSDEVRAKYYTEDTPIADVDRTLSDGSFTGFVELAENVLSGDYYQVYHQGRSMSVAYVGASERLITDDEAFEQADDEVGIYEVRPVDIEPIDIPESGDDADDSASVDPIPGADASTDAGIDEPAQDPTGDEPAALDPDPAAVPSTDEEDASVDTGSETDTASRDVEDTSDTTAVEDDPVDRATAPAESTGPVTEAEPDEPADATATGSTDESTPADDEAPPRSTKQDETGRDAGTNESTVETRDPTAETDDPTAETDDPTPERNDTAARSEPGTTDEPHPGATSASSTDQSSGQQSPGPGSDSGQTDPAPGGRSQPTDPAPGTPNDGQRLGGSPAGGSASDLEVRSIPSLDPSLTSAASRSTPSDTSVGRNGGSAQSTQTQRPQGGQRPHQREEPSSRTADQSVNGSANRTEPNARREPNEAAATPENGQQGSAPAESRSTGPDQDQSAHPAADGDDAGELASELEAREQEVDDLRTDLERVEAERDELETKFADLETERDRLQSELEEARAEIERLTERLEDFAEDGATGAGTQVSASEAIDNTNLFVRYNSKGDATLETAHSGNADRSAVAENMRLEYHTQFDADDAAVGNEPFDDFLTGTIQYRFVDWIIGSLLYEVRDTGHADGMADLYNALPKIDRAELNGQVSVNYTEDGEEHRSQERFDIVVRDRMGNPLLLANINNSRDPATDAMMTDLVKRASRVGESSDSLAGAFLVTESFFEPAALETAEEATSSGLFSRDKRKSFVNLSRKGGYHLCLVEARNQEFHLAVPEL